MLEVVPLEDEEQILFVQWLELQGLKFTSVPNSTYTKSWKQKAHNTATGLRRGFPDLIILIRPDQAKDGRGRLLTPEMKRTKDYSVSPAQRVWISALNSLGIDQIESVVAHGAREAIDYLSGYLKKVRDVEF